MYNLQQFFYCAECKEMLFSELDDMMDEFARLDGWRYYDLEYEDSELYETKGYHGYDEWRIMINKLYKEYFDEAFGVGEVATTNFKKCEHCGHLNMYQSFYINGEFILNQR